MLALPSANILVRVACNRMSRRMMKFKHCSHAEKINSSPLPKYHSTMLSTSTSPFYDFQINDMTGKPIDLKQFQGKVVLAFNSASKCGFTVQLEGLQKLYDSYKDKGLVVIGFPSGDFMQEMSSNSEVAEFCQRNYGVKFPMTEKISVNGSSEHPIYGYMKKEQPGFMGLKMIKWNFEKFLIDREGKVVKRYSSSTEPQDIVKDIEKLL